MIDKRIEIHAAPMQGITDVYYRREHAAVYGGVDFYYTPFIRIERGDFRKRDLREYQEDELKNCVAQVLPGSGEELRRLVEPICAKGDKRVDVNIGCPFPPVMAHGRGAALLNNPDKLEDVLKALGDLAGEIEFSLKMRLGYADAYQWRDVVEMINGVSLRHVAVHARYAKQQYKGECDLDAFEAFAAECKQEVVYNGDIHTEEDIEKVLARVPRLKGVMIGRGLIGDPQLARVLRGEERLNEAESFRKFHDAIVNELSGRFSDGKQVVGHMQTYWEYLFPEGDRKAHKMIKKAHTLDQYTAGVSMLIASL
ncbi:MAG: tRNA-dihydrouridine synthase family protein [Bacteroidales bacterium]|nr:tRNA-dihydrouridine synthase family protein [Bacteroidales bacterium]